MEFKSSTRIANGAYSQPMPDEWKRRLESTCTVDDMMQAKASDHPDGRGWLYEEAGPSFDTPVMRHFGWNRASNFPTVLQEMMDYCRCQDISMFISDDNMQGSLSWHVDWYDVFAFNVEGETTWEWFCLNEGVVKSQIIKPLDNIFIMPSGITHRVVLETPYRASISLVADRKNG